MASPIPDWDPVTTAVGMADRVALRGQTGSARTGQAPNQPFLGPEGIRYFRIFPWRVVGRSPSTSAAPPGP